MPGWVGSGRITDVVQGIHDHVADLLTGATAWSELAGLTSPLEIHREYERRRNDDVVQLVAWVRKYPKHIPTEGSGEWQVIRRVHNMILRERNEREVEVRRAIMEAPGRYCITARQVPVTLDWLNKVK
jgi:hypothetical protein